MVLKMSQVYLSNFPFSFKCLIVNCVEYYTDQLAGLI